MCRCSVIGNRPTLSEVYIFSREDAEVVCARCRCSLIGNRSALTAVYVLNREEAEQVLRNA